jgi:hypothetical protein
MFSSFRACPDFCLTLYMCICQPEPLSALFAILEGDHDVPLIHIGTEELVAIDLAVEGEPHGLAVRVPVSRNGTAIADGAPVFVVRG